MKIFTTFRRTSLRPVVGIGNFDGCHLGHRKILRSVIQAAAGRGTPAVITFSNHTRLGASGDANRLLTTTGQRLDYFRRAGIAACWLIDFNRELSALPPGEFIDRILVGKLGIEGICVGEGFRFGAGRSGSTELLRRRGKESGFLVREIPSVRIGGREVRSSRIREEVAAGRVESAAGLLGHPYCLTGRVVRGRGRGGELGYPTANFFPDQLLPPAGVYAAKISAGFPPAGGILYVGTSPTFAAPVPRPVVAEAHIFDWSGSLGGRRIKVYLLKRLRKDIKFKNEQLLVSRMKEDERQARSLLGGGKRQTAGIVG
jgi:riboflavin kinase / FMN adenylyltransferase